MEHFITNIHIDKLRHLENLEIELSTSERRHLLLTGKNGSGKTSFLETLVNCFKKIITHIETPQEKRIKIDRFIPLINGLINDGISINFNSIDWKRLSNGNFVLAYFPASRKANILMAKGVENVQFSNTYDLTDDPTQNLIKYMVHLITQQAYAQQARDSKTEADIQNWFNRFENALRILLEDKNIRLEYDYKRYNFLIHQTGRLPFGFNELSDG